MTNHLPLYWQRIKSSPLLLQDGPPQTFWLAALFEPGDFLIAVLYIHSLETGIPFHELTFHCKFDEGGDDEKGIWARDLYLVGASWDHQNNRVTKKNCHQSFSSSPSTLPWARRS